MDLVCRERFSFWGGGYIACLNFSRGLETGYKNVITCHTQDWMILDASLKNWVLALVRATTNVFTKLML